MPDIPEQEEESWAVLNLDSGDMMSVEPPVWEQDALSDEVIAWLDELIATVEDPLERSVDLQDLWEDMTVEEYEQLLETVLNEGFLKKNKRLL